MPEAREALYYCAMAYAKLGDNENAKNAARKVVGLSNNKVDDLYKSAVKLYKELP
jgi:outer membrane protein assembly factor BamD (BamD/ComL family)